MGAYVLNDKSLKVNNLKYYRSNGIQLGDVGTKKTSVFSVNRVDSQSNIPAPKMKVKNGGALRMDAGFASHVASMFAYSGLTAAGLKLKLTTGDLKLVRFFMQNRDIENGIEQSPKLIETIKSIGRDARVVSDVWSVVTAEIDEITGSGGLFSFKAAASGVSVTARHSTVSIGKDSILAYMLQKMDWKEKQKKNWSQLEKLIEDPKGL